MLDLFNSREELIVGSDNYYFFNIQKVNSGQQQFLPYSIRILLESVLRLCDDQLITREHVNSLVNWKADQSTRSSIPYRPARVVMQDFTGVPAIVDLGAMRSAIARLGGDPGKVNPQVGVDLVIDHSIQVDHFGNKGALQRNTEIEFHRNRERYEFLHWGQSAFNNFRVVPPGMGIVHQVNLEFLSNVVMISDDHNDRFPTIYPDTLVGTDSHTTMINGLGVLGWGVGGIEAEAALLGQPYDMVIPDVVGVRLHGIRRAGVTATDVTLAVVELLRKHGVVGKFVEFTGSGLAGMSLPDRATIANMAPEYGATIGFFPVDEETLNYLRLSGRSDEKVNLVEAYFKEQGLFRMPDATEPNYSEVLEIDLDTIEPALAGPKRPQDRVLLPKVRDVFWDSLNIVGDKKISDRPSQFNNRGDSHGELTHGSVVIAAITSCTNTSNPSVMLAAGILAKKALERGLRVPAFVKTSLAPGSTVVTEYLRKAEVLEALATLGFEIVGYGCTTCIGNSGPLPERVSTRIIDNDLVVASVLSGNRNFEGRVHAAVKANFLASPPLVVAYALAGTLNIDLSTDLLAYGRDGEPVYLHEIWPSDEEIGQAVSLSIDPDLFKKRYSNFDSSSPMWNEISTHTKQNDSDKRLFAWDSDSTYVREPPYFKNLSREVPKITSFNNCRALVVLGDSITTDHISPAGAFTEEGPAGQYLIDNGVELKDFNSFGARRGNHEIMMRGTFANVRLRNALAQDKREGGFTTHLPSESPMTIYDAAVRYQAEEIPLIVLAGKEYGSGSSRDWAAKGPKLLGVCAVIVESFERIHRSNLIGMGILPLEYINGESAKSLGLSGREVFHIDGINDSLKPKDFLMVRAVNEADKKIIEFSVLVRIDTPIEVEYYRNGGILNMVLRQMIEEKN